MQLDLPKPGPLKLQQNRLEFMVSVASNENSETFSDIWFSVYSVAAISSKFQFCKTLRREMVNHSLAHIQSMENHENVSFIHFLGKIIEFVYPTHQIQSSILANPMYCSQILKRRFVQLGFDIGWTQDEFSPVTFDQKTAVELLKMMGKRLEKETRIYYEFTIPYKCPWRIGLIEEKTQASHNVRTYPGAEINSFGFENTGDIYTNGRAYKYTSCLSDTPTFSNVKVIGIMIDIFAGRMHLVSEGKIGPPAFGKDAISFSAQEQERQRFF
jgi:hypothetical protein